MRSKFLIYQDGNFPFGVTIGAKLIQLHFRKDMKETVLEEFIARYIGRHATVKHSTVHKNKFRITIKVKEFQSEKLAEILESMPEQLNLKMVRSFGRMFR